MDTKRRAGRRASTTTRTAAGSRTRRSPRTSRTTACSRCSRDKSDERTKEIILDAKRRRRHRGAEDRRLLPARSWTRRRSSRRASRRSRPTSTRSPRSRTPAALVATFAMQRAPHSRRRRSARSSRQDDTDPEHYIANIAPGRPRPPRSRHVRRQEQAVRGRCATATRSTSRRCSTLVGVKDADKRAAAVYALEEKIAAIHWTRVQNRDPQKTYNKMTIAELAEARRPASTGRRGSPRVGLDGQTAINVNQPSAITGDREARQERAARGVEGLPDAPPAHRRGAVPAEAVRRHAASRCTARRSSGTPQLKERWKRGVDQVTGAMGEAVGKIYVAKYFTPETKAHADELVQNLLVVDGPAPRRARPG